MSAKLLSQNLLSDKLQRLPLLLSWLQSVDFPHKLGICERLFSQTIADYEICWVQTGEKIPWKLDLRNPTHRWIVYGNYEGSKFLHWARKFLPATGVVVDSGANIGQMTLYLSQFVPQGKVLAFEPGDAAANWLEECLRANPDLPVELIRSGLGNTAARYHFLNSNGEASGAHGEWGRISETEVGDPVQIMQLASALADRSIQTVDLWKLDVEGYEIPALQGAEALLKQQQIKALYVEMFDDNGKQIREYLQKFNYRCHLFNKHNLLYRPTEFQIHCNGLFLPV
jgi:FkbM family methyltransferase